MAKVAITEQYLTDIADAIRTKTGLSNLYYPAEMAPAILTISGSGGITPTGTINITTNGTHDVTRYASASVNVPTGSTILNQDKTVTPTENVQIVGYDSGYTGLEHVTVRAISSEYVGSGVTRNTSSDLSVSGASVSVPAGYYEEDVSTSVATTTHPNPTASINSTNGLVTASHTQSTGYVTGSTTTGTLQLTTQAAKTITPSTSSQTAVAAGRYTTGAVTVAAVSTEEKTATTNGEVTPSSGKFLSKVTVNVPTGSTINNQNKTVNPSTSTQEITADSGYTGLGTVTVNAMPTITLPTTAVSSATSGYTKKLTISRSTSKQYINIPTGYNSAGAYYEVEAVANGSVGTPSATKGTVSNYSVTVTPSVSYNEGYIASGSKSGTAVTVSASELVSGTLSITSSGTKDVTNYASASVASGSATASATKGTVSNHSISITPSVTRTAGYITAGSSNGTAVTVSASELVSGSQTVTENGTVDVTNLASVVVSVSGGGGGGGGTAAKVETATATPSYASTSINFTGLLGEPTSFAVISNAELATGASPWKTAAVVYDGTDLHGQTIRNTSNAQVTYDGSSFSYTYNNGTLTITGSGTNFQANQYKLVYTYGSATVGTAQTQVGSGATSITFTGITDEPAYFSCIFKSNFSTSSGYQRVIVVANDGTSTYGMEMDSSAKVSTAHWSYYYNNGSLTITSQGTNAGGYFHQPGYYQLTYVAGGGDEVILQDKTVSPTESTQYITADEDYTGLGMVTVNAISSTYVGSGITRRSSTDLTASGATVTVPAGYYSSQVSKAVASGSASAPTSISGTSATVSTGTNTLTLTKTVSVTPVVSAGYVSSGTATNSSVSLTASVTVNPTPTVSGATVTIPAGYYSTQTTKSVTTMTLPTSASSSATSGYTKKATISRSTSTQYINIAPGYNSAGGYYEISAVANGSATGPTSLSGSSATITTGTNTITLTKTNVTTTPTVSAGYVSSATASTATVTLTASVTTKAAATITPGTTNQTIAAGTYLTGTQTIAGDADLVGSNIISTANIFGTQGTVVIQKYYTGASAPSSSLGNNGDIYLQE